MPVLRIVSFATLSIALAGCAAQADRIETTDAVPTLETSDAAIMPATPVQLQPESEPDAPTLPASLQDFAQTIAKERDIPLLHVQQLLSEASVNDKVAQLMAP